jgi:hypothetical protein
LINHTTNACDIKVKTVKRLTIKKKGEKKYFATELLPERETAAAEAPWSPVREAHFPQQS